MVVLLSGAVMVVARCFFWYMVSIKNIKQFL